MKKTVVKELVSVIISLLSTILALVTVSIFDGIVNIAVGLDSTITTCCLLAIATPVKANRSDQGCFNRLWKCFCWLKRERRVSKVRAKIEIPTLRMKLENILPPMQPSTGELSKKKGDLTISKTRVNRDRSQKIKHLTLKGQEGESKTELISVLWELRDFDEGDESTHSEVSASSRSSKYRKVKSSRMCKKKKEDLQRVLYDISA